MCARPMPVLPAVPSTTVPPAFSVPRFSASRMIQSAARSFTDPPGLRNSALPRISQPVSRLTLSSRMSGVLPTVSAKPSRMFNECLQRDHGEERRASDDGSAKNHQGNTGDSGGQQPALPALLDQEEPEDADHPEEIHQSDDQQHRHDRPAAAEAIHAVHHPGMQCAGAAALEIVRRDEGERTLAMMQTDALPSSELIGAGEKQNRPCKRG